MSVLIKGIKVHRGNCWECPCLDGEYGDCNVLEKDARYVSYEECPLVELPDHGDLIDRDELFNNSDSWAWWDAYGNTTMAKDALDNAPIVIPAERSETSLCDNCDERSDVGCSWCKRMERSEDDGCSW